MTHVHVRAKLVKLSQILLTGRCLKLISASGKTAPFSALKHPSEATLTRRINAQSFQ